MEHFTEFHKELLKLATVQPVKTITEVDSRWVDPIVHVVNEYGHKNPTLNSIAYVGGHVIDFPTTNPGRVNYLSYFYNQTDGSDGSHPPGSQAAMSQATFF
jgi:hypothetical protein